MVSNPTRAMRCRNISRRSTGLDRACMTAAFLRPSWRRGPNILRERLISISSPLQPRLKWKFHRNLNFSCFKGLHALSNVGIERIGPHASTRSSGSFQAVHAVYLPDHRTDPRAAAADRVAHRFVAGGVVARCGAADLPQPSRRSRDHAGFWPRIPGGHRPWAAAGVLACGFRVPRRGSSHLRRLSVGPTLRGRRLLDPVPARTFHRRWTAGGASGAADNDRDRLQLADAGVRTRGAGASALDAVAVAFLAVDWAGPSQCVVRLVDRCRPVAADDARGDRPVA